MRIGLRYDMRAPDLGPTSPTAAELYAAAVEQCRWADSLGIETVYLAEHHGAEDGYCPAPMTLGAAILGATVSMTVHFSALCITMHHPLRLAEDLAILDLIGGPGRVQVTAGMGYRPLEFEMFGVDYPNRGRVYEDTLDILRRAWTGEEFQYEGRTVQVTPRPGTPGGPRIFVGGNAKPSARRAARLGLGYRPASRQRYDYYTQQCAELGRPAPEPFPEHGPAFVFVTPDPERSLEQLGPHLVHASNLYAQWGKERPGNSDNAYWTRKDGVDSVRADPSMWIVTPDEAIRRCRELPDDYELRLHPLLGGIPPELAWESLELFADAVLPEVNRAPRAAEHLPRENT